LARKRGEERKGGELLRKEMEKRSKNKNVKRGGRNKKNRGRRKKTECI
jgi:hypothetical protein